MSFYNPSIHNRRSIRLKRYDYSQSGFYFITICCHERNSWFVEIVNAEMILNEFGLIAHEKWIKLAERFVNFELDIFQIMPDHMHVIISLTNIDIPTVGRPLRSTLIIKRSILIIKYSTVI